MPNYILCMFAALVDSQSHQALGALACFFNNSYELRFLATPKRVYAENNNSG